MEARAQVVVDALLEVRWTDPMPPKFGQQVQEDRSPRMKALKAGRMELDDAERKEVLRRKAVWHHGPNGGSPTPAVWKSEVRGKTYYVCNTHRAAQVKPTLKGAIRAFDFIKTTA